MPRTGPRLASPPSVSVKTTVSPFASRRKFPGRDVVVDQPARVKRAEHARAVLEEREYLVGRQGQLETVEASSIDEAEHLEATVCVEAAFVEDLRPARMAKPPEVVGRGFRVAGTDDAFEALERHPPAAVEQVLGEVDDAVAA